MSECLQKALVAGQAALRVTAAPVGSRPIAVDNGLSTRHLNKLFVRETID